MTTNHHTPIAVGAAANSTVFNAPLAELDSKITDVLAGTSAVTQLNVGAQSELTVASGVITVTKTYHSVDTEADAATDDLDTISGGAEGDILVIRSNNTARTVVVRSGTGNILLAGGVDVQLDDNERTLALIYNGSNWLSLEGSDLTQTLSIVFFQNGSTLTTGVKHDFEVPFDCLILGWTILADASGSIVIDVWKDTYANYPPTVADTIAGSEKPTLSSATKNQDLTLTTWTLPLSRGDILRFNIDSVATVTRVTLSIRVIRR